MVAASSSPDSATAPGTAKELEATVKSFSEFIRELKKGDAPEITYTEAVAVSLEPDLT
jgi:hypothetical protein